MLILHVPYHKQCWKSDRQKADFKKIENLALYKLDLNILKNVKIQQIFDSKK